MSLASACLGVTILIVGISVSAFAQCVRFDSGYPVFKSLYYVSAPDSVGDRLVVGAFNSKAKFERLSLIPLPLVTIHGALHQCFDRVNMFLWNGTTPSRSWLRSTTVREWFRNRTKPRSLH